MFALRKNEERSRSTLSPALARLPQLPHPPRRKSVRRILKQGIFTVVVTALSMMTPAGAESAKTHHVRDVVRTGEVAPNGRLPQNHILQLDLVLPLRDPAGLKSFLADVYNPASPNYRHFISPQE